jgi:F0F1-type ATP synthase delta subunit
MPVISLPHSVVSKIDVSRLLREMAALEEYLIAARIRSPRGEIIMPRLSLLLELVARANAMNLAVEEHRKSLTSILEDIREHAPTVHISFASNPSAAMVEKLVQWFRKETHPYALVQTGLQPGLAAGCIVRTPNKLFDFSLRKRLEEQKEILSEAIRQLDAPEAEEVVA